MAKTMVVLQNKKNEFINLNNNILYEKSIFMADSCLIGDWLF